MPRQEPARERGRKPEELPDDAIAPLEPVAPRFVIDLAQERKRRDEENARQIRAQRDALRLISERPATVAPAAAKASAAPEPAGIFSRLRSGWDSLKARLFSTQEPVSLTKEQRAAPIGYEKTWTGERLARREPDRQREMESVREAAVEKLRAKLDQNQDRLVVVSEILDRRRREPLPANVRARYVEEAKSLRAIVAETTRLLRIYDATKKMGDQFREAS